jgi:peptide/nickel transport system permease protein
MTDLTIDPADRRGPEELGVGLDRLPHYVSPKPFDPMSVDAMTPTQERYNQASQWRLMWWRLLRHRVAVASGFLLLAFYATTLISEFLAPYALDTRNTDFIYAPPMRVHIFDNGRLVAPFVQGYDYSLDMNNLKRVYTPNPAKHQTLRFFCQGDKYLFWGYIPMRFHLVCPAEGGQLFLLGTDRLGRDLLSRIIYGARSAS